jgi:pyrroline-5-carboxylate reductase
MISSNECSFDSNKWTNPNVFEMLNKWRIDGQRKSQSINTTFFPALAIQTAVGASHMAAGDVELEELRKRVTSPGGTTQAAIESFERNGLRTTINSAMTAAYNRAQEMATELG